MGPTNSEFVESDELGNIAEDDFDGDDFDGDGDDL